MSLLYFTSYAGGLGGLAGPGLGDMMVGLYEGLGDPLADGEGEVGPVEPGGRNGAGEATPPKPEFAESEPAIEPEPLRSELEKVASPPEPDPEALALEKPEPKPEPKKTPSARKAVQKKAEATKPKAAAEAAKRSEKVGRADQDGSGRGSGSGRGGGVGVGGGGQGVGKKGGGRGGGGGGGGSLAGYRKANFSHIVKLIQRKMVYPPELKKAGITGTAKVAFTIGRNGQASNIRLAASSGNNALDQAALSVVRRASPFPAPAEAAHITIPLKFSLR